MTNDDIIKAAISYYNQRKILAKDKYERELRIFDKEIRKVQSKCPHSKTVKFYCGPYDLPEETCEICQKILK